MMGDPIPGPLDRVRDDWRHLPAPVDVIILLFWLSLFVTYNLGKKSSTRVKEE